MITEVLFSPLTVEPVDSKFIPPGYPVYLPRPAIVNGHLQLLTSGVGFTPSVEDLAYMIASLQVCINYYAGGQGVDLIKWREFDNGSGLNIGEFLTAWCMFHRTKDNFLNGEYGVYERMQVEQPSKLNGYQGKYVMQFVSVNSPLRDNNPKLYWDDMVSDGAAFMIRVDNWDFRYLPVEHYGFADAFGDVLQVVLVSVTLLASKLNPIYAAFMAVTGSSASLLDNLNDTFNDSLTPKDNNQDIAVIQDAASMVPQYDGNSWVGGVSSFGSYLFYGFLALLAFLILLPKKYLTLKH